MTDYEQRVKAIETLGEIRAKYNLWNEKERHYYEALSEAIRVLNAENDKRHYAKIVRCKDCRWGKEACGNIECTVDIGSTWAEYHGYEWFCPNGERKEQDDD